MDPGEVMATDKRMLRSLGFVLAAPLLRVRFEETRQAMMIKSMMMTTRQADAIAAMTIVFSRGSLWVMTLLVVGVVGVPSRLNGVVVGSVDPRSFRGVGVGVSGRLPAVVWSPGMRMGPTEQFLWL